MTINTIVNHKGGDRKSQVRLLRLSGAFSYSESDSRYVLTSSIDAGSGPSGAITLWTSGSDPHFSGTNEFKWDHSISTLTLSGSVDAIGSLLLGGDLADQSIRTNFESKLAIVSGPHFTGSEESVIIFGSLSTPAASQVSLGGGVPTGNAATEVSFYTAVDNVTTTGTKRVVINNGGSMGVGAGALIPLELFHVGGGNALLRDNNITVTIDGRDTGTSSRGAKLVLSGARNGAFGSGFGQIDFYNYDSVGSSTDFHAAQIKAIKTDDDDGGLEFYASNNLTLNPAPSLTIGHSGHTPTIFLSGATRVLDVYRNNASVNNKILDCSSAVGSSRMYVQNDGDIFNVNGTYGTISDARLKENIVSLSASIGVESVDAINALHPVHYSLVEEKSASSTKTGFLAQELSAIFPELVKEDGESGDLGINTVGLIPILARSIQQLLSRIETLESGSAK